MGQSILHSLLWLAILAYLCPPGICDCATAVSVIAGTCATVTVVATSFLCAGTAGIGCIFLGAIAACGAVDSGICDIAGIVPIEEARHREIVGYLQNIERALVGLDTQIKLGFFEAKYYPSMQFINQAIAAYHSDVIELSSYAGHPGVIERNSYTQDWMNGVLGSPWNVRGHLSTIEDMIDGGDAFLSANPSVYAFAHDHNRCSRSLFNFVTKLIVEGTTMVFIALEMRKGEKYQQLLLGEKDKLKDRLKLNIAKYVEYCHPDSHWPLIKPQYACNAKYRISVHCGSCGPRWGDLSDCEQTCASVNAPFLTYFADRGCRCYTNCGHVSSTEIINKHVSVTYLYSPVPLSPANIHFNPLVWRPWLNPSVPDLFFDIRSSWYETWPEFPARYDMWPKNLPHVSDPQLSEQNIENLQIQMPTNATSTPATQMPTNTTSTPTAPATQTKTPAPTSITITDATPAATPVTTTGKLYIPSSSTQTKKLQFYVAFMCVLYFLN